METEGSLPYSPKPAGLDFPTVQTGPGANPASFTMGTGSFPGVKCGRVRAADHF